FSVIQPPTHTSTLFPYTTLFRSSFEAAHTAAERETADPRVSDNANGARQPVLLGRLVELLEERAARDARGPSRRVDLHGAHARRSEEHTSELQSRGHLVCRLLLE